MKKILTIGLALASLGAFSATGARAAQPAGDDWRDCHRWDRHHHMCRDNDWDRNRWRENEWYGHRTCGSDHDHYLNGRGRWRRC